MTRTLRLGTRASQLALTQSQWCADQVRRVTGCDVELVRIATTGDITEGSLASLGGTGVFASALRDSLVAGDCDLIAHSLKDLPTADYPGLTIAAIPAREAPNDTLCSTDGSTLDQLAAGARVGTSSPRRAAQVAHVRPDVIVADIRGNVDTRLAKVQSGEYDAVILAAAGLRRLGRTDAISEEFDITRWPTAAGQGALAIECRAGADDSELRELITGLTDEASFMTSILEREVLTQLEAGCSAPVGISAAISGNSMSVITAVYAQERENTLHLRNSFPLSELTRASARTQAATTIVDELLALGLARIPAFSGSD